MTPTKGAVNPSDVTSIPESIELADDGELPLQAGLRAFGVLGLIVASHGHRTEHVDMVRGPNGHLAERPADPLQPAFRAYLLKAMM